MGFLFDQYPLVMSAVSVQHLSKIYASNDSLWSRFIGKTNESGFQALKDVSFTVEEGEFFGLLGPNGAGKTSLISVLAGLSKPTHGSASIYGYDVEADYQQARRALGVVPQELVYDPFFTVRETLRNQAGYFGLYHQDDWIDEILFNLGLSDKADTNMRALSGGMKRRVLVAQALVHRPPVIILDEPTAGVDVDLRHSLWQFISSLNRKGHTIILTTHYLDEAQDLCHRLAFLRKGELIALDKTEHIIQQFGGQDLEEAFLQIMHTTPVGGTITPVSEG